MVNHDKLFSVQIIVKPEYTGRIMVFCLPDILEVA
jgi:hypothetical protein